MEKLLTLGDWERAAAARMEPAHWGYYRSGADDEATLRANRAAWSDWEIHYHVLVDVAKVDTRARALGTEIDLPIIVAPTAFHGLAHADGEHGSARGAHAAGTVFTLSTLSNTTIEDVAADATGPLWYQLYVYRDREITRTLVERATVAGYRAIVLTVDAPVWGRRLENLRTAFELPPHLSVANVGARGVKAGDFDLVQDPTLTWRDLEWLRSLTTLPIVLKGLVRPDDARRAVDHGVAGIVVSNHGGRQLNGAPSAISVIAAIADAVDGGAEIYLDGGIRAGTDVLKAIALGARAVLVGRPVLWGLAVDGAAGVTAVLQTLGDELRRAMALAGAPDLASLNRDLVRRAL